MERFKEVVGTREVRGEVVNITQQTEDGVLGPKPALIKYSATPDLRIIGIILFSFFSLSFFLCYDSFGSNKYRV